jgi:hypothetical protein
MAEASDMRECLIVMLQEELTLANGIRWPLKAFRLEGTVYQDVGLGEWTGFYDWMRQSNGDLIGVRYTPLADNRELFESTRSLGYTKADASKGLAIYFDAMQVVDDQRSCDQEFQYDAVFKSDEYGWAIAFDTIALTAEDRQRLRRIVRRWRTVTPLDGEGRVGR